QIESALIAAGDIDRYRSTRLLDVNTFNTAAIKLTQPREEKGRALALEKTKQGAWWFKEPAYGPAEVEGPAGAKGVAGVRGLLSAADGVRAESDKDFEPAGKNFFPEAKALLRVEVDRTE